MVMIVICYFICGVNEVWFRVAIHVFAHMDACAGELELYDVRAKPLSAIATKPSWFECKWEWTDDGALPTERARQYRKIEITYMNNMIIVAIEV